jgi:ferredoxin--NADP+ reductase
MTMTSPPASHHADRIALPEVEMHTVRPTEPVLGRVVRTELCTSKKAAGFVRHVDIDVSGTPLAGKFRPGQSFGVIPPGVDANGKPHKVRLYSVASPTRGEEGGPPGTIISTTVKRTIDEHWETHKLFLGVASNFLCDAQVGDEIPISGPNGKRFLLPANPAEHDYIFFATGTGIAPFRGMLIDLLESGCGSRVALIMGSPYATDLLYHDFFLRMQAEHPNFQYITAISRERQADGHDPMYVQDRLRTHEEQLAPLLASPRTLIYICGVAGMEMGIFQQLASQFPESIREQYLHVDPAAMADIKSWTRSMIHKQVRPTRRVFLEVYA